MRAGSLRDKLKFERRTRTSDGMGGNVEGWETVADNISARIIPKAGAERYTNDTLSGVLTYEIHIRYSTQVKPINHLCRAIDKQSGEIHNIRSVRPDERKRVLILVTQTDVPT